jgi:hypothetical protein
MYTLHVNPIKNDFGIGYSNQLSIAPTLAQDGAVPYIFRSLAELLESFAAVGIQEETISLKENALRRGRAMSIPCVDLTDNDLRKLGF